MCDQPNVNPVTGRKMKVGSPKHTLFKKHCSKNKCNEFMKNNTVNPYTNRKLSEKSDLKLFLQKLCASEIEKSKKAAEKGKEVVTSHYYTSPLQCTLYNTVTLKDHQTRVCNYVLRHNTKGLVLFHSVGSGKTITSITLIRCLLMKNPNKNVFVITPKSLVENFKKEMDKVDVQFGDNVKICTHGVFINKIAKNGPEFCRNSIIVIDEAHHFKTIKSKTVKRLMKGTAIASQVFLLTATPVHNSPGEFASLYAMITKREDEVKEFSRIFQDNSKPIVSKLLKNKISYFKNNDTRDYPSVNYVDVTFEMTPKYYEMYMDVENNAYDKVSRLFNNSRDLETFINGIRRAVNAIDYSVTTPKVEWTIDHIKKNVKSHSKVLVYSNWLKCGLHLIQNRLDDSNIDWVQVNGTMSIKQRKTAVDKYNSNKVQVIFVSSAGSEGLDLKQTQSVVVLEPHWHNEKIKQVVGRAARYKSHSDLPPEKRNVDVYHLILEKPKEDDGLASADAYLYELSHGKEAKIDAFYTNLVEAAI